MSVITPLKTLILSFFGNKVASYKLFIFKKIKIIYQKMLTVKEIPGFSVYVK